jgi:hypothetical protein
MTTISAIFELLLVRVFNAESNAVRISYSMHVRPSSTMVTIFAVSSLPNCLLFGLPAEFAIAYQDSRG